MQTCIIIDQQGINIHYFDDCFLILKDELKEWWNFRTMFLSFNIESNF